MCSEGPLAERRLEVVVPARNEARRIAAGLKTLSQRLAGLPFASAIVIVDNASTDTTADIVRRWSGPVPVRLLRCARLGKGAAVKTGLLATTAPYVGFCDADMATDLDALDDVLALLGTGAQVVIGSRRHERSVVDVYAHPLRRFGAIAFNRLSRGLTGGVTDTQCGFKFFAGPLARSAATDLRTAGFAFDVELLMHCRLRGAVIHQIPVLWRDMPGSTFSVSRHTTGCLCELVQIWSRARRPAIAAYEPDIAPVADELRAG